MLDFSITFFITLLNLAILFLFLRKVLFKPVAKFMDSRAQSITAQIEQAQKEGEEAKRLKSVYEAQIANAGEEAAKILKNAKEEAARQAEAVLQDAQSKREAILQQAKRQAEAESKAALLVLQAQAAALVLSAGGKLLHRELNSADAKLQAEIFLKELADSNTFSHTQAGR
jgi:F-type H+-transporting ATPase subunit b